MLVAIRIMKDLRSSVRAINHMVYDVSNSDASLTGHENIMPQVLGIYCPCPTPVPFKLITYDSTL